MESSPTFNSVYLFLTFAALALAVAGCRHYHVVDPSHGQPKIVAIGPIKNQTNEPRLSLYTKQKLPELIMLDGSFKLGHPANADSILNVEILTYKIDGIGEVQIESDDKDQRRFRSSVFKVTVDVDYSMTDAANNTTVTSPQQIRGTAEFSELVDMDIVRKDGLRRAMYDACSQVVSSVVDVW